MTNAQTMLSVSLRLNINEAQSTAKPAVYAVKPAMLLRKFFTRPREGTEAKSLREMIA
jgi:hypothetical protein